MRMWVIAELLALEFVVAGGLSPAGFTAWESSPAEAISRAITQWAMHGNEPISNELVWLSITDRDRRAVEQVPIWHSSTRPGS